jgi:hypothetical protein
MRSLFAGFGRFAGAGPVCRAAADPTDLRPSSKLRRFLAVALGAIAFGGVNASAAVPGQPTAVAAVAGNGQAVVSFTAPASDGGSAITGYTVTSSPGGLTGAGASSPITVTGLTNGTDYTFTVAATNDVGTGAGSIASAAATPGGDWAHNYGDSGSNTQFHAVATDSTGNVYAAGYFRSATLTLADTTLTRIGNSDAVVAKFSPTGTVIWAKNFGGDGVTANGNGIAVDSAGNVYLGGEFSGGNLTTPAEAALTKIGTKDAFALKLNAAGGAVWAKNFGGVGDAFGNGIAVDGAGNVYLGGYFSGGNLTTPGLEMIGTQDAFALKLNAAGDAVWAKNFGGVGGGVTVTVNGNGIAVDSAGNVYLGGYFSGGNLTTPGLAMIGTQDAFALKLNAAGGAVWAKNFGGAGGSASGYGVAVDGAGNVYLGGNFSGANLTIPAAAALTRIGSTDAYVLKLDATGATTWARNFGGPSLVAYGRGVVVNGAGDVCLGGYFGNGNLTTPAAAALTKIGTYDAFALKLDATGATTWAKNFGGLNAISVGEGVALDGAGNVYLGVYFNNANLTRPALTKIGWRDALLLKCAYPFATNTAPVVANLNGDSVGFTEDGSAVLLDAGGNANVTDEESANFDTGNVTLSIVANRVSGEDVLSIANQGTGAGQIGVSGSNVTYGGTTIGSFTGGSGTNDLVVSLNANSTPTNVQALVRNLTYSNTNSGNPSTSPRTVRVTVNDGDGGTSAAADVNVAVTGVNDAPVLDPSKSPTLVTIAEDTPAPTNGSTANSTLVSSLVDIGGALSNVTDVDSGAVTGIAVTAVSGQVALYYTTNGGTTWTAAPGTVTAGSALLLAADANTRIAVVPQANIVGTDTDAITFKAWDRTSGSNGATGVNTTAGSAFSAATDMAPVLITAVNDAPTIDAGTYTLTGTDENTPSSVTQVATIATGRNYADVDVGAIVGIAVTASTANGTWQYSTDGSTGWTDFGTVDVTAALLLTSGTYVRYVPDNKNGETATFTFRAWDRTVALASINGTQRYADTSTNGGTSQFSTTTANASLTVADVNDAPVFVGAVTSLTVNENTGATSIKALLHASDPDNSQTLTWTQNAAPAHGTLSFLSATAATPGTDITPGGTITYTPTANYAGSDTFTVQVSDGTAAATRTINVTASVVATELRFTTQPSGSVSGVALTGQPVVRATDTSGNVDTSFTGNVTLALGSGAGSLSGTLTKAAVAGVATFTDLSYAATADQQAFTLTTANTASLTNATSSSVTSDVVATKLRFATQPAPLAMASTVARTFTTAPVVQAVDAANVVDTAYATAIVLTLTKSDGSAAPGTVDSVSGTGDTDGGGTTVTLVPTSGAATFSGLSVRYTNSAANDSLALHATSGGLTAANSAAITSRIDVAPTVDTVMSGGNYTESGAAVVVSSSVTVTDADDVTCAWATVSISQNFTAGQDVLSFTNNGTTMGNITAAYDAGTGVLTLTSAGATATRAQWAAALSAVKYANTSEAPNTATRQMLFVINDGYLSSDSSYAFAKTNVAVAGTNDAPTLSGGPFALDATDENTMSSATAVSTVLAGLTYADPDGSVASGIAITQKTGASSWAYSTDGVTWAALGSVSNTSALLLSSTSWVRYLPNGANGETATLTFRAWDQTSGTASTNITRRLVDPSSNGGTTAFSTGTAQATLAVAEINDAPTLTATPVNPSFTENGSAVDLFSTVSISTVEAGQGVTELQFTVTNVSDSTTETVVADGTMIALADGGSGTTATNALTYSVALSGSTATVMLSKVAGITTTAAQDLIDGLTYGNTSDNPGAASRVVTITSLKDNGGTLNGGTDTTALAIASTVAVTPVNDAPMIGGAVAAQAVNDTATIAAFATLTISDPDSMVSATVAPDSTAKGAFTLGSLASSGFATADGGATYTHAATTPAAMQIAIRRLMFAPTANRVGAGLTETTRFVVTISDGVAAPVANNTTTVISTSVNNAPVVTSGGAVTVEENQTAACTVTGSDLDPGAVLSYAISGGADAARFAIDAATGVVTFKAAPDFESPADADGNNTYDITVTASDGSLTSTPRAVALRVINANEAPTDLALSGTTLGQAAGTNAVIGTLSTTDPDAGDTFTYTLVAGTGATDNASFNISGPSLRANNAATLTKGNCSVRVRSTDAGGLWFEKALTITVTDNLGPTVSSVTGPPAGTYRCGDTLEFIVKFNDTVIVTGTPKLNLTIGGVARAASYVSGSGSTDLLFRYIVVQGDHAASGELVVGTLDSTGATIRDSVGNDATLTFTAPTLTGVLVDALTHSADTNTDWRISLIELTRVIELYNTRNGTSRTGEYHCEAGTEDGFAPGTGTLTSWHSADSDRDGRIGLIELTRVIELYNTRSGTARTGDYHAAGGTEDGFAPGTNN